MAASRDCGQTNRQGAKDAAAAVGHTAVSDMRSAGPSAPSPIAFESVPAQRNNLQAMQRGRMRRLEAIIAWLLRWSPLIAVFLLGLWLRWSLNGTWRLGTDEALYSTWAREIASGADVWLAHTPGVDKPPLAIYPIAGSMLIYGYFEFASRFPAIIASAVSVLLLYFLAWRLYHSRLIALLAALLLALSPIAILYAPTAYADPLLTMWLLLAALLAAGGRWGWAGVAAGLAVLTKQEAPLLFALPVLLGWAGMSLPPAGEAGGRGRPGWAVLPGLLRFAAAATLAAAGIEWLWESTRPGQASPFALGLAHYGGVGLVSVGEIVPRLAGWWDEALQYVFAAPPLNVLLIVGGIGLALSVVRYEIAGGRLSVGGSGQHGESSREGADEAPVDSVLRLSRQRPAARRPASDALLLQAVTYGVLARTLVSFQMWDRYMLVAAPLLCIVLARVIDALVGWLEGRWARAHAMRSYGGAVLVITLVALLMVGPVGAARAGQIPVGSDHGLYTGIDVTAQFIRQNVPPGSVIYHSDLGWQFGYYLYGVHLDFWWYPSLQWLAETAAGRASHSQYIVVPAWDDTDAIAAALRASNLVLLQVHTAYGADGQATFVTYRIAEASN